MPGGQGENLTHSLPLLRASTQENHEREREHELPMANFHGIRDRDCNDHVRHLLGF